MALNTVRARRTTGGLVGCVCVMRSEKRTHTNQHAKPQTEDETVALLREVYSTNCSGRNCSHMPSRALRGHCMCAHACGVCAFGAAPRPHLLYRLFVVVMRGIGAAGR